MAADGELPFPVVAVDDARRNICLTTVTVQASRPGWHHAGDELLIAGSSSSSVGYGWCGRGIATRARGLGANVIVVEADPLRALEAVMEGTG